MSEKMRFGDSSNEDSLQTPQASFAARTQKNNNMAAEALKQYLRERNEDENFEDFDESQLSETLGHFYMDVRTKSGELYKAKSFECIRYGLNRYLKASPHLKKFDIITSLSFLDANKCYMAALVEIKKAGKGSIEHYPKINENDFKLLYDSIYLSPETPSGLLNRVQMNIRLFLCRRTNENMELMTKDTFAICSSFDGTRYVVKKEDELTKNQNDKECISRHMPEDKSNSKLCPVANFATYLSKLNPKSERLWQYPRESFDEGDSIWYQNRPIGKESLSKFMNNVSKKVGLSRIYTNSCIHVTGTYFLSQFNFTAAQIMSIKGQQSVNTLTMNQGISDKGNHAMSAVINDPIQSPVNNTFEASMSIYLELLRDRPPPEHTASVCPVPPNDGLEDKKSLGTNMETNQNRTVMMIEGYEVFKEDQGAHIVVKQEPIDPVFTEQNKTKGAENTDFQLDDTKPDDLRAVLTQIINSRKDKELSVKNVVEQLVKKNALILAQSDTRAYKPNSRKQTSKPKAADSTNDLVGNVLQPKDPTVSCTSDDVSFKNINEAIVETNVHEQNDSKFDPDLVCAIGSKVHLTTQQGQTLQIDLTYYWCNFCNYKSDKKDVLLQHMLDHRFHCKYCKFQSFSRASVIKHCVEQHEEFKDVSPTLKYCTYLPDILQRTELQQKKRKREEGEDSEGDVEENEDGDEEITGLEETSKKPRYEVVESSLSMEVEEVGESGEVSTTSTDKIIIPRPRTAKNTLPAPVKPNAVQSIPPTVVTTSINVSSTILSNQRATSSPGVLKIVSSHSMSSNSISNPGMSQQQVSSDLSDGALPVISSVYSGAIAVEQAETQDENSQKPEHVQSAKPVEVVTVTSGLCWNCGYCEFITLSQSFLKIHLNGCHQGKPHKYVALLVSSKEQMDRIKKSDAQLWSVSSKPDEPSSAPDNQGAVPKPKEPEAAPIAGPSTNSATVPNIIREKITEKEETIDEKKIPVSYKCAHCNFSGPDADKVTIHLKSRHIGCVMYVLDMKAVKLRKKRYLFFCLKKGCDFKSKEADEYVEHVESCTPVSPSGKSIPDMDTYTLKSLNLTKQFIAKTSTQPQTKDFKVDKVAEYGCLYCSYVSNNNTRLKKHVISNHQSMQTAINSISSDITEGKRTVYFCNHCLWETKEATELDNHLMKNHKDSSKQGPGNASGNSNTATNIKQGSSSTSNVKQNSSIQETREKSKLPLVTEDNSSNLSVPSTTSDSRQSSVDSDGQNSDADISEEDKYSDIIGKSEYERLLATYIASEELVERRGRGRPPRNAAVKSQIKNKLIKPPPLYQCFHCKDYMAFGIKLIRPHIAVAHKGLPLQCYDRLKLEKNKNQAMVYICPFDMKSDICKFHAHFVTDIVNHAKKDHGVQPTHPDLMLMNNSSPSPGVILIGRRPATAATGESYECLYCTDSSKIYYSRLDMKKHLIETHSDEDFLFRDCIARKLRQQSRYFMCHSLSCDYTCETQNDYNLHLLAHKKSKIYECSKCSWFTEDSAAMKTHTVSEHNNEEIHTIIMDLDLDSTGQLVKLVGGTVIKTERP